MTRAIDRFLDVCARFPDAAAIHTRKGATSYGQFGQRVRQLAAAIAQRAPGGKVLIRTAQGENAYATMLGSLMAGAVYSPLNVDAPAVRQQMIADRFQPDLTVVDASTATGSASELVIDRLGGPELAAPQTHSPLAYVIFTSGSTGTPKGVMIARESLDHYLDWAIPALKAGIGERISQHPNIGFDLSVIDIYAALCSGSTLVPLTDARDRLMPATAIAEQGITTWISVPSVLDLMQRAQQITPANLAGLRRLFFCGEQLLPSHLDWIFAANPTVEVINTYGPTEATVSCTAVHMHHDDYRDKCDLSVTIGPAIPGMRINLIGGAHADEGEVVISGPQVAEGYWDDAHQTSERFRPLSAGLRHSYFTGDWAERKNGQVYFRQRMDRQIKRYGYRIELGEIDEAVRRLGAATVHTVHTGGRLITFIEGPRGADLTALRKSLGETLPAYAVPDELRYIDRLPRNANDKIDTLALLEQVRHD